MFKKSATPEAIWLFQAWETAFEVPSVQAITFEEFMKGRHTTVCVTEDRKIVANDLIMAITGLNHNK